MSKELEARLIEWAREYAGSKYDNKGWAGKSWLHDWTQYGPRSEGGSARVVALGTQADKVEEAVVEMERAVDGFRPGRVLRCEYWMPSIPEEMRLQALRAIGLPMSRAGYYLYLGRARFFVAAWLRIPISDSREAAA